MRSKKLTRQIRKAIGNEFDESSVPEMLKHLRSTSLAEQLEPLAKFAEGLSELLDQVDTTYAQLDEKVAVAEKSLTVSSAELAEANHNLFSTNHMLDAMVNSLGQGFFLFGPDGICLPMSSRACQTLLEIDPSGKSLTDVLRIAPEKRDVFSQWLALLFSEPMDFDDLAMSGPRNFPHSLGLIIGLEFKPVRDVEGKIIYIVIIATDHTAVYEADRKALKMYAYATMVVSILKEPDLFKGFVYHSRKFFKEINRSIAKDQLEASELNSLKRSLHTIKGSAGTYGFMELKSQIHQVETTLTEMPDSRIHQFLKEKMPEVERSFEQILIEHQDIIGDTEQTTPKREITVSVLKGFAFRMRGQPGVESSLYSDFIEELLCVPVAGLVQRYDPVLQETAKKLEKKVSPILYRGENIRLFPEAYGTFWTTLEHIFRNAVSHGIETEQERRELGKLPEGRVWIDCARRTFDFASTPFIHLAIHDDGSGINLTALRATMVKLRGPEIAQKASDQDLIDSIFGSGVSTAKSVSEISGRGVGLDAVKSELEALGGRIWVESREKKGTTFNLALPYFNSDSNFITKTKVA